MERHFFDKWLWLHVGVGMLGYTAGINELHYVLIHSAYELLSNTQTGMEIVNKIPLWPNKPDIDPVENILADPFWGWVGWRLGKSVLKTL